MKSVATKASSPRRKQKVPKTLRPGVRRVIALVAQGATQVEASRIVGYDSEYISTVLHNSEAAKRYLEESVERIRTKARVLISHSMDRDLAAIVPGSVRGIKPSEADPERIAARSRTPVMAKLAGLDVGEEWQSRQPAQPPVAIFVNGLTDAQLRQMFEVVQRVERGVIDVEARAK